VEDKRVTARERHRLYDEDLVKFGNEVTRGPGMSSFNHAPVLLCSPTLPSANLVVTLAQPTRARNKSNFPTLLESFPPLHVVVRFSWVDDRYLIHTPYFGSCADNMTHSFARPQLPPRMLQTELPPNTFQVPDYDDDEDEDEDISFVQETVLKPKPKIEVVLFPTSRAIPENSLQPIVIEDSNSEELGQGIHTTPSNATAPPPSFSSRLVRSHHDALALVALAEARMSAAAGPSGLSEVEWQADKRAMNIDEHTTSSLGSGVSTDKESSAKSNSSVPTSSHTKEPAELAKPSLDGFVTHSLSSKPTAAKKRTMSVDEDLTQSESGSNDANSHDLMVDDSEDGQGSEGPTDYGSDCDEEALLIAENDETGAPRAQEEDLTDDESSCSVLSDDDIGMDQDEDFFDDFGKIPGTKQTLPNNAPKDYDKAATQHEQIPYNMRPGNFSMQATRLSLPPSSLNRAPSPSDAAMVKSSDFASGGPASMGRSSYPYMNPTPWSNPMASAYGPTWPYAFDRRSHPPYDDRYSAFPYTYGGSCVTGHTSFDTMGVYESQMTMPPPPQSFDSHGNDTSKADQAGGTERLPKVPISVSKSLNNDSAEVAQPVQDAHKSFAKVSIDSIVERVSDEPVSSPIDNKLKRKADDMATDKVEESASEDSKQTKPAGEIPSSVCPPLLRTINMAQLKSLQTMPTVAEAEVERPAKRARTDNGTGNIGFATLAATALAGAIVGGVGVVAALVSLPQDFFV